MQSKNCCQNCLAAVMNCKQWALMIAQLKAVKWLHRWKLLSSIRWKFQRRRLTFLLPAMKCCCCILVLVILRFDCLTAVIHLLVERTSEDFDGMIDVYWKYVITQSQAPSNPPFGTRKSEFWMLVFWKRFLLCYKHHWQ